jgi:outer membrane protein assembly factor BamD (BamD/ComL family)
MAARCLLGSPPQKEWYWTDTPRPSPAAVRRGHALLRQLLEEYPQTRFRVNALGWLGRCEYVQKRYPEAMRLYLKQLLAATTEDESIQAMASLHFTRRVMNARDAKKFAAMLLAEPDLAVPYFDQRLNHFYNKPAELASLAQLAEALVRRHPGTRLPPVILARLAEVHYHRGRYRDCVRWATRALAAPVRSKARSGSGVPSSRHDLAYYLRGAARHKLKDRRGAIADFEALLRRCPHSYLRAAARENLAILYEERGDLGSALEHYFALGYEADLAFLLDARMTIPEIERFIAAHPRHPQRDLVIYSLGIRYLRADNLGRAERTLRRLPARSLRALSRGESLPEYVDYVRKNLHDPLTTIRDLRRLKATIRRARTANDKADARYALATYYYQKRNLLFYNPALWEGSRSDHFSITWNTAHATPQDEAAARQHHYEHECVNRTREICLDVARRYPRSPAAPRALYVAACCARRLADFDGWWRKENKRHDFWAESVRLMKEMARRYPGHRLTAEARKYAEVFGEEERRAMGW